MVSLKVKHLKTLSQKTTGLLNVKVAYPVYFNTHFGIHTFGLGFFIDVIIINKQNVVQKVVQSLAPNRVLFWNPRYDGVIELPVGTIKELKIEKGDTISVICY